VIVSLKVTVPVTRTIIHLAQDMEKWSGFEPSVFITSEEFLNVFIFDSVEFLDQLNIYLAAEGLCTVPLA